MATAKLSRPGWAKRVGLGVAVLAAAVGLPVAMAAPASAALGVTASINVGGNLAGIAVDSASGTVYVADGGSGTVSVINEATGTVTGQPISVNAPPGVSTIGIAVDHVVGNIYVTRSDGFVSVINESTDQVAAPIPVGVSPSGIAVANGNVYVANHGSNNVSVISEATDAVIATIGTDSGPAGLAADPNTGNVYVACQQGTVDEILPGNALGFAPLIGGSLSAIAFDPNNPPGNIYTGPDGQGGVSVMTGDSGIVTAHIGVGIGPNAVAAVDPTTHNVYVTNPTNGTVSVISDTTNQVTATIPVGSPGSNPVGVAADSTTGNVYVTNSDGTVSVIGTVATTPSPTPSPTPSSSPSPSPSPAASSSGAVTATGTVNEVVSLSGLSGTVTFPSANPGTTATVTGAEAYTASTNDPAGYALTLGASGTGLTSASGSIPNTDLTVTETSSSPGPLTFGPGAGAILTIAKTAAPSSDGYTETWALTIPATAAASTYSESFVYLVLGN